MNQDSTEVYSISSWSSCDTDFSEAVVQRPGSKPAATVARVSSAPPPSPKVIYKKDPIDWEEFAKANSNSKPPPSRERICEDKFLSYANSDLERCLLRQYLDEHGTLIRTDIDHLRTKIANDIWKEFLQKEGWKLAHDRVHDYKFGPAKDYEMSVAKIAKVGVKGVHWASGYQELYQMILRYGEFHILHKGGEGTPIRDKFKFQESDLPEEGRIVFHEYKHPALYPPDQDGIEVPVVLRDDPGEDETMMQHQENIPETIFTRRARTGRTLQDNTNIPKPASVPTGPPTQSVAKRKPGRPKKVASVATSWGTTDDTRTGQGKGAARKTETTIGRSSSSEHPKQAASVASSLVTTGTRTGQGKHVVRKTETAIGRSSSSGRPKMTSSVAASLVTTDMTDTQGKHVARKTEMTIRRSSSSEHPKQTASVAASLVTTDTMDTRGKHVARKTETTIGRSSSSEHPNQTASVAPSLVTTDTRAGQVKRAARKTETAIGRSSLSGTKTQKREKKRKSSVKAATATNQESSTKQNENAKKIKVERQHPSNEGSRLREYVAHRLPQLEARQVDQYIQGLKNVGFHPDCESRFEVTDEDLNFMLPIHRRFFLKKVKEEQQH